MQMRKYSVVSVVLIGISAAVAALSSIGDNVGSVQFLLIGSPDVGALSEIASGQVWRLLTPIFLHFGVLHLVFNMMWVWDLGKVIESVNGARFYLLFVVVCGVASNLVQVMMTGSPLFGGMSGVVYGLFGYLWIMGRNNPRAGFVLNQNVVMMMLGWFVLCWTGLLGPIANWAHTAGLLVGVVWAYPLKRLR
jgi:GlpG protein